MKRDRWIIPVGERGRVELSVKDNGEFWLDYADGDGERETCLILTGDELRDLRRIIDAAQPTPGAEGER